MMQMIRKSWWGRAQVATLASAMTLTTAMPASAASRVNVMPDRQVRPGVSLPVFGSADGGVGAANGQTYAWTFAFNAAAVSVATDGSTSGVIANDRYIVENVTFTLLGGSTRQVVVATLRVDGNPATDKSVNIDVVGQTDSISDTPLEDLAVDVNISIEDALRAMYLNQTATGYWTSAVNNAVTNCGTTGYSIWAFSNSGHRPTNSSANDIYSEWVQKAVDWVLTQSQTLVPPPAGSDAGGSQHLTQSPDRNSNGRMLSICAAQTTHDVGYSNGIITASLVAAYSANPGLARTAPPFNGETYGTIIQDSVDWLMVSQEDDGVGQRGGWRYTFEAGADTSADSWTYVGLEGAEQVLGLSVLEDVKRQAELRIHDSQAANGQFGYTGTSCLGAGCNAVTGGGLSGLVFVTAGGRDEFFLDQPPQNGTFANAAARKAAAVTQIGANWHVAPNTWGGNLGNFYAMWTQARALRLHGTTTLTNQGTTFDWETGDVTTTPAEDLGGPGDPQEGYFPFLVRTQQANGNWPASTFNGNYNTNLNNGFGVLILQPRVFPPPCEDENNNGICDDEEVTECDADDDNDIDNDDLLIIRRANRQQPTGVPEDPRDANNDGKINVADYRYCSLRLTGGAQ